MEGSIGSGQEGWGSPAAPAWGASEGQVLGVEENRREGLFYEPVARRLFLPSF